MKTKNLRLTVSISLLLIGSIFITLNLHAQASRSINYQGNLNQASATLSARTLIISI